MAHSSISYSVPGPHPQDEKALLEAIAAHKPLLARWARAVGFGRARYQRDDAWQAAELGFIDAYRRYDPSRGVSIGAFASQHVIGAVREALAPYMVRGNAVSIEDVPEDSEDALQVSDPASRIEIAIMVREFVKGLTRRQQYVVEQVFWHDRSQAEVARELGISRQAVAMTLDSVYARGRRKFARDSME